MGMDYHNPFDYMFYNYFNKECSNENKRDDRKSIYDSLPLSSNFDWLKWERVKHIFKSPILFGSVSEELESYSLDEGWGNTNLWATCGGHGLSSGALAAPRLLCDNSKRGTNVNTSKVQERSSRRADQVGGCRDGDRGDSWKDGISTG